MPYAREDVLEAEEGREAGGALERLAVEHARVLEEVDGPRRGVVEPEPEEAVDDRARDRLGERHRGAAPLADRDLQGDGAGTDDVEHAVRAALERERHRLGPVLLVGEMRNRGEAKDGGEVARRQVTTDSAVEV